MPNKGVFITLEGGDGTGKSTQNKMLCQSLIASGLDRRRAQHRESQSIDLVVDMEAVPAVGSQDGRFRQLFSRLARSHDESQKWDGVRESVW